MDPLTMLAAFAPIVVDGAKALIGRFIGSEFKPASVADWVTMQQTDIERFKALNAAGGANPSYPWVEAIIRLQRPFIAAAVIGVWAIDILSPTPSGAVNNFAAAIGFYLFGDRTLFHIRNNKMNGK